MKTFRNLIVMGLVVALLVSCAGRVPTEVPPTATPVSKPAEEPTATPVSKPVEEPTAAPVSKPAVELGEAPESENNIYATIADYEAATGNSIGSLSESPMLADMVKSGNLPPVEERLPNEPAVVRPKVIGQYGGEIRLIGYFEGAGAFSVGW